MTILNLDYARREPVSSVAVELHYGVLVMLRTYAVTDLHIVTGLTELWTLLTVPESL